MAKHMLSMCIFCLICATHSPCASHAVVNHSKFRLHKHNFENRNNPPLEPAAREKRKITEKEKLDGLLLDDSRIADNLDLVRLRLKRHSDNNLIETSGSLVHKNGSRSGHLRKIFEKFGDGETINLEGFEKLLMQIEKLKLDQDKVKEENQSDNKSKLCINKTEIISNVNISNINTSSFLELCPALLYPFLLEECVQGSDKFQVQVFDEGETRMTNLYVWLYSNSAVFLISACGVLSLVIIPVMQNRFYKPLIQFLVALAVGTLAGDALLHLLPHAMSTGHGHEDDHHAHTDNMWKGFVAMMGLTFFFFMEKIVLFAGKWRKGKQKDTAHPRVVLNEGRDNKNHSYDTECKDKYNPYGKCYGDFMNDRNTKLIESEKTATTTLEMSSNSDVQFNRKTRSPTKEKLETIEHSYESASDLAQEKMLPVQDAGLDPMAEFTVILREHESNHHGHSHKHGHVHAAPQNFKSVAWMVIMGDGLHNLTDGLAIGVAFSGGIAGGFSTAVAVFCHELPHELGDFAMLLKAGMTIKQALFYNLLSSFLCFIGNVLGIFLGNTGYASSWVFAAAAGMFLYIALVDMIPELSSAHEDEGNLTQCLLHLSGLLTGFGVMTIIALYEHDLKHIFHDPK